MIPVIVPILNIIFIKDSNDDVRNSVLKISAIEYLLLLIGLILGTFGIFYQKYIDQDSWKLFFILLLLSLTFTVFGGVDIWISSEYLVPLLMFRTLLKLQSTILLIIVTYILMIEIIETINTDIYYFKLLLFKIMILKNFHYSSFEEKTSLSESNMSRLSSESEDMENVFSIDLFCLMSSITIFSFIESSI